MEIGIEISLYPLEEDFAPRIKAFLERLRAAGRFKIVTTSLSTQLFGEYDEVLGALAQEMRAVFAEEDRASAQAGGKAVFLLKLFGPLAPPRP
jgi:uncharacterized protein YqgV (UPF0045/DUF77 family)